MFKLSGNLKRLNDDVSNIENQTHRYSRCGRPWKASSSMESKELAVNNLRSHGKNKT